MSLLHDEPVAPPADVTLPREDTPAESGTSPSWSAVHRVAFRFWFAFIVVALFPYPIGALPGTGWAGDFVQKGWDVVVTVVASRILHLPNPIDPTINGSGDRTYDWIALGVELAAAVIAAAVWTALDKRRAYVRLREALRIVIRYEVGASMLGYGLAKIFVGQFPPMAPARLLEAYGDSSPMGLLWNFMGYSRAYCVFTGAAELVGGLLLFHRRTTTLGALVLTGVLVNVVALNLCYDVPVKIYSTLLLVQVVWLVARNARALFGALLGGTAGCVTEMKLALGTRFRRHARLIVKTAYLLLMAAGVVKDFLFSNEVADVGPYGGFYEVVSFESPGASTPPTVEQRWRRVIVGTYGQFYLQTQDGQLQKLSLKAEKDQPEVELRRRSDGVTIKLRSASPDATHWSLDGTFFGLPISVSLAKVPPPRSFLMDRGFHWVNEVPLNR